MKTSGTRSCMVYISSINGHSVHTPMQPLVPLVFIICQPYYYRRRFTDFWLHGMHHKNNARIQVQKRCVHESRGARQVHNKQSNTNQDNSFLEKGAALGGTRTHDTPLTRQSALPTELPGQLSWQGSQSTTQGKVKPQYSVLWHKN